MLKPNLSISTIKGPNKTGDEFLKHLSMKAPMVLDLYFIRYGYEFDQFI